MKPFAATATALLALLPGIAAAAEATCLTRQEATALIAYGLPEAITGTVASCAPVLPADSFLRRQGPGLAARYAGQKDKYWPQARPAFLKALNAGGGDSAGLTRNLPEQTQRQLADVFVEGLVSQRIVPASCGKLDLAIDLLSPLPPENTAGLIALSIELASKSEASANGLRLCRT